MADVAAKAKEEEMKGKFQVMRQETEDDESEESKTSECALLKLLRVMSFATFQLWMGSDLRTSCCRT